jgi:hypothetical protein
MDILLKNKGTYLMIAGTFLPAFIAKEAGKALKVNSGTQNILFIAGLVVGGMLTAKMLKK